MANTRIGTVNNLTSSGPAYPAGTYDLNFLDFGIYPFPAGQITFDFGEEPTKITGIQKVVQIYLKCLLTPLGSDVINSSYGTQLGSMLQNPAPNFSSATQALQVVQPSITSATSQVITLTANNPPDSALQSVTINGLTWEQEILNLNLYLVTKAGTSAQIAVPQPQLNLALSN